MKFEMIKHKSFNDSHGIIFFIFIFHKLDLSVFVDMEKFQP